MGPVLHARDAISGERLLLLPRDVGVGHLPRAGGEAAGVVPPRLKRWLVRRGVEAFLPLAEDARRERANDLCRREDLLRGGLSHLRRAPVWPPPSDLRA